MTYLGKPTVTGSVIYWDGTLFTTVPLYPSTYTLTSSITLDDTYSNSTIFANTDSSALTLTLSSSAANNWNALIVREGQYSLTVSGSGGLALSGSVAVTGSVVIGVDNGAITVIKRSATKAWTTGVIS